MNYKYYNYNDGKSTVDQHVDKLVKSIINDLNYTLNTTELRNQLMTDLTSNGWSGKIKIDTVSNISITSIKNKRNNKI